MQYHGNVAQSVEKWDMNKKDSGWNWGKMASLRDRKFSRKAVEEIEYIG